MNARRTTALAAAIFALTLINAFPMRDGSDVSLTEQITQSVFVAIIAMTAMTLYWRWWPRSGLLRLVFVGSAVGAAMGAIMLLTSAFGFRGAGSMMDPAAAVIAGGGFGAIFGVVISLACGPLRSRTVAAMDAPPESDGHERVLSWVAWLTLGCGAFLAYRQTLATPRNGVAALVLLAPPDAYEGHALLCLAAVLALVVMVSAARRRAWLGRILRGQSDGWSIEPATAEDTAQILLARDGDQVLVHSQKLPSGGAFRDGGAISRRVGRIPREPGLLTGRIVGAFVVIVTAIGLQPYFAARRAMAIDHGYLPWHAESRKVPKIGATKKIAVLDGAACAQGMDSTWSCWGNSAMGVVDRHRGYPDLARRTPVPMPNAGTAPLLVGMNGDDYCVVREPGVSRAFCSGENAVGQLGVSPFQVPSVPPPGLEIGPPGVVELASGALFTIVLTKDGHVWEWGQRPDAPISYEKDESSAPHELSELKDIVQIAAGPEHACALDRAGEVYCWGAATAALQTPAGKTPLVGITRMMLIRPADRITCGHESSWAHLRGAGWMAWGRADEWRFAFGFERTHGAAGDQSALVPLTEHVVDVVPLHGMTCGRYEDQGIECFEPPAQGVTRVTERGRALEIAGKIGQICARGPNDVWCWDSR